jgi:hypothetical protein
MINFDPVMFKNLEATQVGTVGEYFVASILGGFGYEVFKVAGSGFDILVSDVKTGDMTRVNVKTKVADKGSRSFSVQKGKTTTFRPYDGSHCDLFALLCLEDQSLCFTPVDEHLGKSSIYINRKEHRAVDPYTSWMEALSKVFPERILPKT